MKTPWNIPGYAQPILPNRPKSVLFLECAIVALFLIGPFHSVLHAQNYLTMTGISGSTLPYPAEMGTVDAGNGNLHLEIPLGSFPQRGGSAPLTPKLIYDSHIWTVPTDGASYKWTTTGQLFGLAFGTWGFDEGGVTGAFEMAQSASTDCDADFMVWGQSGAQHYFRIPGTWNGSVCSGGTAYATDSSGFQLRQTQWSSSAPATISLYAPDGTEIYGGDLYTNGIAVKDPNGNYLGLSNSTIVPPGIFNPAIDTLKRTVIQVRNTNSPATLQVMNSSGGTSPYYITYSNIPVKTNFGESGITECNSNCTVEVITKILLPDLSSYTFLYDCDETTGNAACNSAGGLSGYYGTLTSMTLPTGATVTYGYTNFTNSSGAVGHWLTSKNSGIPYNNWSYSPTTIGSTSQQISVFRGDGSKEVTTLTIDGSGSVWPTQTISYDTDGLTVLSTLNNTWDFSVACTTILCGDAVLNGFVNGTIVHPHQDIRKQSTSTTFPVPGGNITKQTTYTYDSPQTGNVTGVKEWKYQSGTAPTFSTTPDRGTYTTYTTIGSNNNINHPTSVTVCNNVGTGNSYCIGGGTPVWQTLTTYDGYGSNGSAALLSVTGAANHDDQKFGTSYKARGNATQITQGTGSNLLTTAISYDTTGQVVKVVDSNGNSTTYSHTDNFYDDNGADPPAAHSGAPKTNAYITGVTDAIGSTSMGYYYGSGQAAFSTDYDTQTTYGHYADPFDRPTKTDSPIGWVLNGYQPPASGQTEIDSYAAIGDTAATGSASCTRCTHTQVLLDSLGRPAQANLVNNPSGPVNVTSSYDGVNRVVSSSHPNFGSSDFNDVVETQQYDGLGRVTSITHPDNESASSYYGASVGNVAGLKSQQGSTSTYGYGFPIVSVDEAGNQRQEWVDGFGKVIEVDEPGLGQTPGQGSVTISGAESATYGCIQPGDCGPIYDSGNVSLVVNGSTVIVQYGLDANGQPACNSNPFGDSSSDNSVKVAQRLSAAINNASGSLVTASVSGSTINLIAKATGTSTNYSLSASSVTTCGQWFPYGSTSFPVSTSGSTLTGGSSNVPSLLSPVVTNYQYNPTGQLVNVIQGAQTRSYQYDTLNRLTQEVTPEGGTVQLSYVTSAGALCSGDPSKPCYRIAPAPNQTGSATVTTTYTYDTANRLTKKTHSDTTGTITYTYRTTSPGIGQPAKMTDPSGSETYEYDKIGRVTSVSKSVGGTTYATTYGYNSGSQLTRVTYPSGRVVYYNYDNVGHLCQVATATSVSCGAASPYLTLFSSNYDAAGRSLGATYGNGVVATASYSPKTFELTTLSYAKGTTTLFGLKYYYQKDPTYCMGGNADGDNGQIQCITDVSSGTGDAGRSTSYTYDQLGRLLTANTTGSPQYPAWGLSWTYDRYGNRTNQTITAGFGYASSLTINPANNQITSPAVTYDATGNVIAEPSPLSTTSSYDGEECNTGYTGNGSAATYTCDGNQLRVKKVVTGTNAVTTVSIRSGGQVIAEYDGGAAVTSPTREYLYGNNLLATVTGSTGGAGGTIIYQHRDHLSPRLYTDANGNDVGEQGAYPFGEPWYSNNTTSQWVFTSYERDKESGNDYALARSYANSQGRFLAPDPLEGVVGDPQSWNRYAYVENDPINLSDPSGQGFWENLGFAIADVFVGIFAPEALPQALQGEAEVETTQSEIEAAWKLAGLVVIGASQGNHKQSTATVWACGGGTCSQGGQGDGSSSDGSAPQGGGPGAGTAQDTGASGQGPSGGGATSTASGPNPTPGGGTISNPSGGNIWDECGASAACMGRLAWAANFSAGAGDVLTVTLTKVARKGVSWVGGMGYGENVNYRSGAYWEGAATGAAVGIALSGPRGPLFGTRFGGNTPLLNSNNYFRVGWSYLKSSGTYSFRIGGAAVAAIKTNPHINLWPPSMWFW